MHDNFDTPVLAFTLRYEGGKVDDPRDPGGRTNQGITQKTYAAHRRAAGLPAADVFAMNAAERDAIYRAGFWEAVDGAALPAGVDLACFDFAVNSGPARARAALQRAGGLAAATRDPVAAVKAVSASRLSFLHALGTFRTFGRGWTARVTACEALGVKMALEGRYGRPAGAKPTGTVLILRNESRAAALAGTRRRTAAKAAGAAALTAAAAPALGVSQGAGSLSSAALALLTLLLAWRAHQTGARAAAYAALAR